MKSSPCTEHMSVAECRHEKRNHAPDHCPRFLVTTRERKVGEMRIKIEQKAVFMYAVFLDFSKEYPHPEDEAIKAYLDAHELITKAPGIDTFEAQDYEVTYFGSCYLGNY